MKILKHLFARMAGKETSIGSLSRRLHLPSLPHIHHDNATQKILTTETGAFDINYSPSFVSSTGGKDIKGAFHLVVKANNNNDEILSVTYREEPGNYLVRDRTDVYDQSRIEEVLAEKNPSVQAIVKTVAEHQPVGGYLARKF